MIKAVLFLQRYNIRRHSIFSSLVHFWQTKMTINLIILSEIYNFCFNVGMLEQLYSSKVNLDCHVSGTFSFLEFYIKRTRNSNVKENVCS